MRKQVRRLALNGETVRRLGARELSHAIGGAIDEPRVTVGFNCNSNECSLRQTQCLDACANTVFVCQDTERC